MYRFEKRPYPLKLNRILEYSAENSYNALEIKYIIVKKKQ